MYIEDVRPQIFGLSSRKSCLELYVRDLRTLLSNSFDPIALLDATRYGLVPMKPPPGELSKAVAGILKGCRGMVLKEAVSSRFA